MIASLVRRVARILNPPPPRHYWPIPAGWKVDRDDWLWRPTRNGDQRKVSLCDRAFVGDEAEEAGRTYCSEVWEALYLDGIGPRQTR